MTYKKDSAEQLLKNSLNSMFANLAQDDGRDYSIDIKDLYEPSEVLIQKIKEFEKTSDDKTGKLLEQITFLAFSCIKCLNTPEFYQSETAQFDCVVSGDDYRTMFLMFNLRLPIDGRTIIVEVKDRKDKVSTEQFLRICGLMEFHFNTQCHLGVFITRNGASGFDKRCLEYSRAVQALFHAKTGKFVIVLDEYDLPQLKEKGGFIEIIRGKIAEVETRTKKYATPRDGSKQSKQTAPPKHIAELDI